MAELGEQMSKMKEDDVSLLKSPITYGNILGAKEQLGKDTVTPEDAALMQSAEARTFGQTQKDGAASVMQAAAQENVKAGFIKEGDHSRVAEQGVIAQEILVPGTYIHHALFLLETPTYFENSCHFELSFLHFNHHCRFLLECQNREMNLMLRVQPFSNPFQTLMNPGLPDNLDSSAVGLRRKCSSDRSSSEGLFIVL